MRTDTRRTFQNASQDDYLLTWGETFIIDRKANGAPLTTIKFYTAKLKLFFDYCEGQAIKNFSQLTPSVIREYLLYLEGRGHNPGGRLAAFKTLRAFLYFYEDEVEDFKNPIRKVKAPRVGIEPLEPVPFETVSKMIKTCNHTFTGDRDAAILLCLLDTGARASEFLSVDLADVNTRGEILIRKGKGSKPRTVYLGKQSRRALRRYLRHRQDDCPALWVCHPRYLTSRLSYEGLRTIFTCRAKQAGVDRPTAHAFRRAFALAMLRAGTDVFTLAKLMGHEGIGVLQRYLKQTTRDTEEAHRRASPVDNLK